MSQEESVTEVTIRGIRIELALQSKKEQPLRLYGVVHDDEHNVTCFVEAIEGEAFQITINDRVAARPRGIRLSMGGRHIRQWNVSAGERKRVMFRALDSDSEWRALTFCKPTTTDDDKSSSVLKDEDKLAEFGVIKVEVAQMLRLQSHKPAGWTPFVDRTGSTSSSRPIANGPSVIYERSKKAIGSLDARLGDPVQTTGTHSRYGIPDPKTKACTFRFVCLSRLGLQLRDFVPHEEVLAERERERKKAKRAREEARLEAEESQLIEKMERIKRRRANLDAEASTSTASSSSQFIVKPDPDRVPFNFNSGGRSIEDPLLVEDSD
ncbi:hypothetical protein CF319_g6324 [Tilletia indica]|nr:hypothetical protein CF319_g6324 [Tilletia indica]KAE8232923.1 hypothetical protein CF326_g2049 [Tilletia indica]